MAQTLDMLMHEMKMMKIDDDMKKTNESGKGTDTIIQQDLQGGQPLAWAAAVARGDRINMQREEDCVQKATEYKIGTPDQTQLESLLQKWTKAKKDNPDLEISRREIIDGEIVPKFDEMVMEIIKADGNSKIQIVDGGLDFSKIELGETRGYVTPTRKAPRKKNNSPDFGDSPTEVDHDELFNLNIGDGNGSPDNPGDPTGPDVQRRNYSDDRKSNEFRFVTPRNVTITIFTGKNLNGEDGDVLLRILDHVETYGAKRFTTAHLANLKSQCSKALEYDRAIKSALLNWTSGIAHGLVKYRVDVGLDAWRKLYHKYMPLAVNMQNILIRELMSLKPVSETEVDQLFHDVERICDLYIKAGAEDDPNLNKWVKASLLQNLPDKIVTHLALELKDAESVEEMQSLVNTMTHDHRTGLLRGQPGPTLYLTEQTERGPGTQMKHDTPPQDSGANNMSEKESSCKTTTGA